VRVGVHGEGFGDIIVVEAAEVEKLLLRR